MKTAVFLANVDFKSYSGISKKVVNQAISLSKLLGKCVLIQKKNNLIFKQVYLKGELVESVNESIIFKAKNANKYVFKEINENNAEILYYRLTLLPSITQVHLFRKAKDFGVNIFYEIPTYPYFKEQVEGGRIKILTFLKMVYDLSIFLLSYRYVHRIPVIISSSKVKKYSKFFQITNGINTKNIRITEALEEKKSLDILGVGTLHYYHGYERIIDSIYIYYKNGGTVPINFHIVGDGPAQIQLKKRASQLELNNILFHGRRVGKNLDTLFSQTDVGIGALSLYKKNANIDTTLKFIEYLVRGIPVITSGEYLDESLSEMVYCVKNDDSEIMMENILSFSNKIPPTRRNYLARGFQESFDWLNIMERVIYEIKD